MHSSGLVPGGLSAGTNRSSFVMIFMTHVLPERRSVDFKNDDGNSTAPCLLVRLFRKECIYHKYLIQASPDFRDDRAQHPQVPIKMALTTDVSEVARTLQRSPLPRHYPAILSRSVETVSEVLKPSPLKLCPSSFLFTSSPFYSRLGIGAGPWQRNGRMTMDMVGMAAAGVGGQGGAAIR